MADTAKNRVPHPHGAGEVVEREFIRVVFQSGFPRDVGINGCRIEDVVQLAIERIEAYQAGPLACEENQQALRGLASAKRALAERLQRRQEQGVLNTMAQHETDRTEDWHDDFSATGA